MELNYYNLKNRQREVRDAFSPALALRTHRALSWLERAEREEGDHDARFIFLWIAFNAAYANEIGDRKTFSERKVLLNFLKRLEALDRERLLYQAVWDQFTGPIRLLIDNRFVFQPFWDHFRGQAGAEDWEQRFSHSRRQAHRALGRQDTLKILAVVFDRLYVLRNQLIHGGATWGGAVNRQQIRDGAAILGALVPIVIHLMLEAPYQLWGEPSYPVVE